MSEKEENFAVALDSTDFPVDDSVFNTNKSNGAVYPDGNLPTSNVSIAEDTEYNLVPSPSGVASVIDQLTFDYASGVTTQFKLVFKGWGTGAQFQSPQQITNSTFSYSGQPVSLVFGEFMKLTGNTFNLAAGSTIQLTEYYNSSSGLASGTNAQGFLNNNVTLGDNSKLSLVLDTSYLDAKGVGYLNVYQFSGNTFTFGNNVDVNLSTGTDTLGYAAAGTTVASNTMPVYNNNTFYLGENNTLTFGETYTAADSNIIYAGTGSTINFQSLHSDAWNSQSNTGLFNANSWNSNNQFIFNEGVSNVTVNVDPYFNMNLKTWDTGINGTVNFSGKMMGSTSGYDQTKFPDATTVNIGEGSAFNITGPYASVNFTTFNIGKGGSLNIGQDVMVPTSRNYNYASSNSTVNKNGNTGTVLNSDNATTRNSTWGIFNSTVNFADGDSSSTLTLGNSTLKGGKEITYLLDIQGMDKDHGRFLLENLNGFQLDTVVFFNQLNGTDNGNSPYVQLNFKNDAGETAIINLNVDMQGQVNIVQTTDGSGGVAYYLSVCFNQGTLIQTIDGVKAVEALRRGDLVKTKGGARAVSWVGHKTKETGTSSRKEDFLVLIKKDALADNVPSRDLRVTGEHCLYLEDKLVPARMLVNGRSIVYDFETTSYTIWHVECAAHQVIFAENVAVESYLDTGNRYTFEGCDNVMPLKNAQKWYSEAVADLCTNVSFVEPIWNRINQRAVDMNVAAPVETRDDDIQPNIYLCIDNGQEIYPVDVQDQVYTFVLDKPTDFVSIMSYVASPEDVYGSFVDDRRELGIAVGCIQMISADGRKVNIDHHLSNGKEVGWYDLEGQGVQYRWTKGCAYLPLNVDVSVDQKYTLRVQVISTLPKYFKKTVKYDFLFKKAS
ncbi:Hint domain-containing protein [Commensalibacter papalotli (ex Botero et al. 2024)]|uniref:Large exoprotein involved in heme utilization or adhesion (FhaB) (PDB:4RM6) n=1 Tax=Commensalibacter papalotli (ex Botero et al. 2024) TaxID=2972766 RepID=A0ABM9HSJ7_9PROT|nr:Hint domain-containing protein [Commensalibacter papalotli (ex Botero et al. 2024)]CAI3952427.1 Large exoprotein involved in heme utilization or adhesion (FhaB) (PDB:4RM6) [Commensalibacter papalotli (ex Botero et al. 2024)]